MSKNNKNAKKVAKVSKSPAPEQIAEGIEKRGTKCYYITFQGVRKYASAERFAKLLERAGGDYAKLVETYRVRNAKKAAEEVVAEKITEPVAAE